MDGDLDFKGVSMNYDEVYEDFCDDEYFTKYIDKLDEAFPRIKTKGGECNHKWKRYIGITEVYDFCENCDKKRDIK